MLDYKSFQYLSIESHFQNLLTNRVEENDWMHAEILESNNNDENVSLKSAFLGTLNSLLREN